MKKSLCCLLTLTLLFISSLRAQSDQFKQIDAFVEKIGTLDSQNVAQITQTLTQPFPDKEQKARAIFSWIANNIAIDVKAFRIHDEKRSLPEDVIKNRKGTPLGFAKLFQEMSSGANIRCLVVDGYVKNSIDDLNNPADEVNHSWNVIQLGTSPDQWFFVNAFKASGIIDKKMTAFTKEFTSGYFFSDRILFNLEHFPDNDAWQLGPGPKSRKEFYSLPVFYNTAHVYGLKKPIPATGLVKAKTKTRMDFKIPIQSGEGINTVSLVIGDGRKMQKPEPMNFTTTAGSINFSYQFKTEDTYPVKIMVNEKPVLEYMVEVSE